MKIKYKLLTSNIISLFLIICGYSRLYSDYISLKYIQLFSEPINYLTPTNQLIWQFKNINNNLYLIIIVTLFLIILFQIDLTYTLYKKIIKERLHKGD